MPFEIGVATERDSAISAFALDGVALPDYLKKWPYLRTFSDLDKYMSVAISTGSHIRKNLLVDDLRKTATAEQRSYSAAFHRDLKRALSQS